MQPTLVLSASHPGILYINGRFSGEIGEDAPLIRPVCPRGAVYLDYRPLTDAHRPMARKLVFSGGSPMSASVEEADGLNVILWPGNTVEIEISPECTVSSPQYFQLGGHNFILDRESLHLMCGGHHLCTLPEGAEPPELYTTQYGAALIGRCAGGKYLLSTDSALRNQTGFLRAGQLDIESDERIRAVVTPADLVGHAVLETWKITPDGLMLLSSEPAWADGAPHWPKTPEETARAAVEAALAGLDAEAERYLSPMLRSHAPLADIRSRCDLCVEMKYTTPDSRPCVGLLKLEGGRLGRVSPLYFRASPSGGPQGPYQIEELEYT